MHGQLACQKMLIRTQQFLYYSSSCCCCSYSYSYSHSYSHSCSYSYSYSLLLLLGTFPKVFSLQGFMVHRVLRITKEGTIRWYILLGRTCHDMKEWTTLISTTKRQCVSKIPNVPYYEPNSRPEKPHKNVLLNKYQPCRGVYFHHLKGFSSAWNLDRWSWMKAEVDMWY